MLRPYAPIKPTEPKKILPGETKVDVSNYTSIDVPFGTTKIYVEASGSSSYGYDVEVTFYHGEYENPNYDKELDLYKKALAAYKKAFKTYEENLQAYEEQERKKLEEKELADFKRLSAKYEKLKAKINGGK